MDSTFRWQERLYRLSLHGVRDERVSAELDRLLADCELPRLAVRRLLAELGIDLVDLPDDEMRGIVRGLLDAGRLHLEDITPPAWRGLAIGPADEPEEPDDSGLPADVANKYKLVELVEGVDRNGPGTVGGPAMESGKIPKHVDRTDKEGGAYKQFINLEKDIDGASSRHPENGRYVELWARIDWQSGDKSKSLSGKTIKWKLTTVKHSGPGRPATFDVDAEKEGLGGANGKTEATSSTDGQGWAKMRLYLSQYAGDSFNATAEVDTADSEAIGGAPLKAGPYVVWRKFWFQLTKPDGNAAGTPTGAVDAFAGVSADLLEAETVTFKKTDTPAPPDRTFYPTGMTVTGSSDATEIALIGGHNRDWFWGKFNAEKQRPVKGHLIICDGQWDPAGSSGTYKVTMTAKTQTVTVPGLPWNAGVLKPALTGAVLGSGKWRISAAQKALFDAVAAGTPNPALPPAPASFDGPMTDADVSITMPRSDLGDVTFTLPAGAPDPTAGYDVEVVFKVAYGKYFAGESVGVNMLIKFTAGSSVAMYGDTVSHEFGHGFQQVPPKPDQRNTTSLPAHANQYFEGDGHGGQGSHCSTDKTAKPVSTDYPGGQFVDGTCIMFHQQTTACSHTFCDTCQPHLRLQPFDSLA